MEDIDRTHIAILQEIDRQFQSKMIPISRPEQFIAELDAMKDNTNRTVWDMQSLFTSRYPKSGKHMDYIHPYNYNNSYVYGVRYPTLLTYDELRKSWKEAANADYVNYCQKIQFLRKATRWIDAICYMEAASQLNNDSSVKMYSMEKIGWNRFRLQINDNIKIALNTNFGFGNAAYFLLAVQYKGLDILPYSYIVKYYKAHMADIVRCTRSYIPCRESWLASFDFISDFINNSIADPEAFVKSYIMREVKEMMRGLEEITKNPIEFMGEIGSRKADPCIINIRSMNDDDKRRIQSYSEEIPILFKVEKITGALDFLNSLTEIAKEVRTVQPYINKLVEINLALYPEIQNTIAKIKEKVDRQLNVKTDLESDISNVSEKLTPFEEEISRLRNEATQERPFVLSIYETEHPEYVKFKKKKQCLQSQLNTINRLISDLNSFLDILNSSIERLDDLKQSA